MIVLLKPGAEKRQLDTLINWLESRHLEVHTSVGASATVLGLIGDTSSLDIDLIRAMDIVEDVHRIQEPYKNANRKFHPEDTVVTVGGPSSTPAKIGGGHFGLIAGPCSVESEEQICRVAAAVKEAGATLLRGGAFKPRTSPYAFQGMGGEGIRLLLEAREKTGLPIVTEVMDAAQLPLFQEVDMIQVGARNMQNFELLKTLGKQHKPILLKRGLASTMQEWLMSAEYIMAGGNAQVVLCERGIRTFETATRNTLDLSCVPLLHEKTHLPVLVDPSHATGIARLVPPLSLAAAAAGADGLLIEVHNDPAHALCDGPQSLTPEVFADLAGKLRALREDLQ